MFEAGSQLINIVVIEGPFLLVFQYVGCENNKFTRASKKTSTPPQSNIDAGVIRLAINRLRYYYKRLAIDEKSVYHKIKTKSFLNQLKFR